MKNIGDIANDEQLAKTATEDIMSVMYTYNIDFKAMAALLMGPMVTCAVEANMTKSELICHVIKCYKNNPRAIEQEKQRVRKVVRKPMEKPGE